MDYEQILKEQFHNVTGDENLDSLLNEASDLTEGLASEFSAENIFEAMSQGQSIFDNPGIIETFRDLFLLEIKGALILCVEILIICIIIGILKGLSTSFSSRSVSDISILICSMIISGLCISSFKDTYALAIDSVATMVNTMEILMPVIIGVLIATGSVTSGTVLSPMIIGSVTGIGFIIKTFVLPALFVSTILGLINCLTEKDYVNKLAKLIRNASVAVVGMLLVIMTGVISIQGLLTDTSDGILINTAKYSMSNFIPIVGGFTSDTVELFLRCMSSIKSVLGIFGIIILLLLLTVPLVKILATALIYKFTGALAEPVADSKISGALSDMGSCMVSISAVMFFTSLLFIMFITIVIKIGGN
ncbi:MAG: stage III sporulation protein AE [Firmicutes bacterium]|nr:stage III sporulation protein AE [Bacillota bacterium]MDD7285825.1 stage III sporulation protein AE [Bacillota bacterium]